MDHLHGCTFRIHLLFSGLRRPCCHLLWRDRMVCTDSNNHIIEISDMFTAGTDDWWERPYAGIDAKASALCGSHGKLATEPAAVEVRSRSKPSAAGGRSGKSARRTKATAKGMQPVNFVRLLRTWIDIALEGICNAEALNGVLIHQRHLTWVECESISLNPHCSLKGADTWWWMVSHTCMWIYFARSIFAYVCKEVELLQLQSQPGFLLLCRIHFPWLFQTKWIIFPD